MFTIYLNQHNHLYSPKSCTGSTGIRQRASIECLAELVTSGRKDITVVVLRKTDYSNNQFDLQEHFETLKVENATHKMNLDAQISRAKADFLARQEIAVLKQELGFDLSEQAAYHLEEMQHQSTDNNVADSTSESGNQEASEEDSRGFQDTEPGNFRNDDYTRLEALKARFLEKLHNPDNPPLFENLERSDKLEILKFVLQENLGIENPIFLCWGVKSGGRNHTKYQDARTMLTSMVEELNQQGFTENNS